METKVKSSKGHATGSHNFTAPEIHRLLHHVNVHLPMGPKGWDIVMEKYNAWVKEGQYPECNQQSIRNKFDSVHWFLKFLIKPTGDAECGDDHPLKQVLVIKEKITAKSGTLMLDDPDYSEVGEGSGSGGDESVIEITDDEKENAKASKNNVKKGGVVAKAYWVERPLADI
ncbi:hypothetical protein L208DRAFT_1262745 [Tricholoma matsutake]|nr:hypothetical protein L208DRAFT_1262745 [Tricholoma matsutake 945]